MTTFAELPADQQKEMVNKLADLAVEMDLDVKVETYRELVCALMANGEVSERMMLKVEKEIPLDMKAKGAEFTEKAKAIVGETKGVSIKITSAVGAGDAYDTITKVKKMGEDAETEIKHEQGQVWLLDFWATWCPPCQKPMQHNVDMLAKKKPEWENVRIIGLSIDRDMDTLKNHVEKKEWGSVEHYWRNESDCSDVYSVRGVPCVMLINQQGKIVYKGHPASRNLEQDLDDLAAGKTLEGEGIVNEKPSGDSKTEEEKPAEGQIEIDDAAKYHEEINTFKPVFEDFKNNKELMDQAKDMMRAFCVLVMTTEMNPKTKKTMGKYENYRVLVGK